MSQRSIKRVGGNLRVVPRRKGCLVNWTSEYEKLNYEASEARFL